MIRIVPEWNVKIFLTEPSIFGYWIRIVPEWNVKSKMASSVSCVRYIRIVPEWNVKKTTPQGQFPFDKLESYQSGM